MSRRFKCRACGSEEVRRSHRRGFQERVLLRLAFRAPYRCTHCGARFAGWYFGPDSRINGNNGSSSPLRFWAMTAIVWLITLALIAIAWQRLDL